MSTLIKNMIALCMAVVFLAAAVYCCCFSSIQWTKQKHSCCKTKDSQTPKSSKHDCPHCNSSFNIEQSVKVVHDFQSHALAITFVIPHEVARHVVFVGKSLFIHGPPGPFYAVPLYIKNPTLRI